MILIDNQRIVGVGMFVEAIGKQNPGAEVYLLTPELAQHIALEAHVLEPFCGWFSLGDHFRVQVRAGDRGNYLVERELDRRMCMGIEVELEGLVVEIAGFQVPVLALAPVRRQPEALSIGQMEELIDVEDGLNVVVAGIQIGERAAGVAEGIGVDDDGVAGGKAIDVDAETLRGEIVFPELHARLGVVAPGEDQDEMTVERVGGGHGDFDPLAAANTGGGAEQRN